MPNHRIWKSFYFRTIVFHQIKYSTISHYLFKRNHPHLQKTKVEVDFILIYPTPTYSNTQMLVFQPLSELPFAEPYRPLS